MPFAIKPLEPDIVLAMATTRPVPPAKIIRPFDDSSIPKKPPASSVPRRVKAKRQA